MKKLILIAALFAASCGPIPLHQAEQACFERARMAKHPTGEVSAGVTSNGKAAGGFELNVSSDFLLGRDPAAVYDSCVYQKSGQAPSRPLYSFPEWKG